MFKRAIFAAIFLSIASSAALAGIEDIYIRPPEPSPWAEAFRGSMGNGTFIKSYALVIGVGDYDNFPKLSAPAVDAIRMRDFLRDEAGFDYIATLTDEMASRSKIETLMENKFPNLIRGNDRFLLYFSGHGATRTFPGREKRGYLVLKPSKKDTWDEMVDMPRVKQWAENIGHARHSLFILDACFSGLAVLQSKGEQSRDTAISRLAKPAHHLLTAGVEDEMSYSFQDGSLFTNAFLEAARGAKSSNGTGVISLSEVVVEINRSLDNMREKTPGLRMSPHQYLLRAENNAGEFFFLPKNRIASLNASLPNPGAPLLEPLRTKGDDGTADLVQQSPGSSSGRAPTRVSISPDTTFFDPTTGKPTLWYWRSDTEYEFYNTAGYHQRSGEKLSPFTKEEAKKFDKSMSDKELAIRKEKERLEKDRLERETRDVAAKEARARKQEEERISREAEATRASEAGQKCDMLAANPNDKNKVVEGVSFAVLKAQNIEAIKACELAVKQQPKELRFKYQLGRSLQWTDRPRAFAIHQELTSRKYPASYDNLGWMYFVDRKDTAQAVSMFRLGVQAGDADSMISLTEMIDRGHYTASNATDTKVELCRRASELGHKGATLCYQAELAKQEQAEKERIMQLEQQKVVLQIMGTVLQNAIRR